MPSYRHSTHRLNDLIICFCKFLNMFRFITLFILIIGSTSSLETISSKIINKNVERIIDLSTQLVKVTSTITIENTGTKSESSILLFLELHTIGNLSYIGTKDSLKNNLVHDSVKVTGHPETTALKVQLGEPLTGGRTTSIHVEYIYRNALVPSPSSITQKDKQLVKYTGSHYAYTPYKTSRQTTSLILNSRHVESFTKLKPFSQADTTITYGPYTEIAPLSHSDLLVHYENNAPFLTVTHLERIIEVSHWGNVAVEEHVEIVHTGARLKGSFSRYDYQRDSGAGGGGAQHSVKSYRTVLPSTAHSIYYRDSNGNISTSAVRTRSEWIDLELRPRFPLFGGWRSAYTLGYSVPAHQYLFRDGDRFVVRVRLLDHIFDDMQVDELVTEIVLPVGVVNVEVTTPFDVERLEDDRRHKYLDNLGRVVVRLRGKGLVEQHMQDVEITYEWKPVLLLHEPLCLTGALFILFAAVIVWMRIDCSLQRKTKQQ